MVGATNHKVKRDPPSIQATGSLEIACMVLHRLQLFFPSVAADIALRLGPNIGISE